MSLEAPTAELRRLGAELIQSETVLRDGIAGEVNLLLRREFATGEGPYGTWKPTVRGRQPLQSRRLQSLFTFTGLPNGLRYSAKSKRDMLAAHQVGHEFPARQRAANQQFLTFNAKGRLAKSSRILNKKGEAKRGWSQTFARAHTVGQRILPARPIVPEGGRGLPSSWQDAMARGATAGMMRWHQRAEK